MTSACDLRVDLTVLDATSLLAIALGGTPSPSFGSGGPRPPQVTSEAVVGSWHSPDGAVRLSLRTDGTYAGEVAGRRRPARGTYRIEGGSVLLRDDSGLQTAVAVQDGELEMAGHRLRPAG
ncbi:Atu4866 domain-containing protein [Actinoplanes flavus]|uniref:Atu4866 domain-containing protein n=1 Tax=Actinoplanes flavus TaxID=2820290 RepID=A0ABS3UYR3_9ACTN|nr:Atu4866 domain-containing protein [Actinoplanes flavus]MBO3743714.1 Atu4866 domain-containing protein [Actinoplanes flavus]